ncbi:MAG: DUF5103 domain-containing protein [Prevotella sp.]|nr:DUF5103 domain-containing protein [Prevotella sp.]
MERTYITRCIGIIICIFAVVNQVAAVRQTIYSPQIKTLQAVVNRDWLSPPVMTLGSGDILNVAFDELSHEYHRFTYRIEHCEADWSTSTELFESDYLSGFNDNPIEDYRNSINTTVLYTHYSMQLPNDRCSLKMSGNYRLTISDEDGEKAAEVRFMVVEPLMNVSLECSTNTDIDVNKSHQQISMGVSFGSLRVTNHSEQLHVVVSQNDRDDNIRSRMRPSIITARGLEWRHCRDLIFAAGNEYHKYEILDVSHPTMGIDRIVWDGNDYNVYPFASGMRTNYLYDTDANGSFYIRNSDNIENDFVSEYVYVHYRLLSPPVADGRIVIDGRWTTDDNPETYVMQYDETENTYRAVIMQKQGYYSYQYLLKHDDGTTAIPPTEGSFFQTENRYQAYVYYKGPGERTWRLVGYRQI